MNRLKSALERLDAGVSTLEKSLDARMGALETTLRDTRAEHEGLQLKAKNAQKVGQRLDEVILQLEHILGEKN